LSSRFHLEMDEGPSKAIAVRKRDLVIKLQTIQPHPRPKVALEQYTVPADLAAEILFRACYVHDDIEGKSVLDLGTGTGRLVLGASILGAEYAIGVDLDHSALEVAAENCGRLGLQIDLVLGNIEALRGAVDTVVMNPPFGTKRAHADIHFLEVALRLANVIYSIHKSSTSSHLCRWLTQHDSNSDIIISSRMEIPHQFSFHTKRRQYVDVDVYRIVHS